MDNGMREYKVLSNTHSREALLTYALTNGIVWEESNHPGVNWLRASQSIVRHLENKKEFFTDNLDPDIIQQLLQSYQQLIELHKMTMIPHLRSAMQKLKEDSNDSASHPMDSLEDAHVHLAANGGVVWADKIHVLRTLNTQVKYLEERSQTATQPEESK